MMQAVQCSIACKHCLSLSQLVQFGGRPMTIHTCMLWARHC